MGHGGWGISYFPNFLVSNESSFLNVEKPCTELAPQCPMPNAQCPMPNAQSPIPNPQCPIPNAPSPMPNPQFKLSPVWLSARWLFAAFG
jgi:hypothetical protein